MRIPFPISREDEEDLGTIVPKDIQEKIDRKLVGIRARSYNQGFSDGRLSAARDFYYPHVTKSTEIQVFNRTHAYALIGGLVCILAIILIIITTLIVKKIKKKRSLRKRKDKVQCTSITTSTATGTSKMNSSQSRLGDISSHQTSSSRNETR
uniref:Uncharacterized protein n=1 Tax=Parastrongyloides trichosuri TaxID=131310 RepID=A0A0N4ZQ59_PARTI